MKKYFQYYQFRLAFIALVMAILSELMNVSPLQVSIIPVSLTFGLLGALLILGTPVLAVAALIVNILFLKKQRKVAVIGILLSLIALIPTVLQLLSND